MKYSKETLEKVTGITLIALVVTIVVLLILVGITMNYVIGDDGIFQKAQEAGFKAEVSSIKEQFELKKLLGDFGQNEQLALEGLKDIQSCLDREIELMKHSANDTNTDIDRVGIAQEVKQLIVEIDRIESDTKNKDNISLLNGEWKQEINATVQQLGIEKLENDTTESSMSSIEKVESAKRQITNMINKLSTENINGNIEIDFEIPEKWKGKLKVVENELTYIGTDAIEKSWASDVGIDGIPTE